MAKPNHSFQKRQRELAKQKKREEKRQRKLDRGNQVEGETSTPDDPVDVEGAEEQD
jgi:hypothetical protein